jgi:hypothetical protein
MRAGSLSSGIVMHWISLGLEGRIGGRQGGGLNLNSQVFIIEKGAWGDTRGAAHLDRV